MLCGLSALVGGSWVNAQAATHRRQQSGPGICLNTAAAAQLARILLLPLAGGLTRALPPLSSPQGIFSHPWFVEGLNPAALQFNDSIVRESLANQPSPDVLNEVRRVAALLAPAGLVAAGRTSARGQSTCSMSVRLCSTCVPHLARRFGR